MQGRVQEFGRGSFELSTTRVVVPVWTAPPWASTLRWGSTFLVWVWGCGHTCSAQISMCGHIPFTMVLSMGCRTTFPFLLFLTSHVGNQWEGRGL